MTAADATPSFAPGTGRFVIERWNGADVRCYPDRVPTIVHNLAQARARFAQRSMLETPEETVDPA
jgi:hypothetical protein